MQIFPRCAGPVVTLYDNTYLTYRTHLDFRLFIGPRWVVVDHRLHIIQAFAFAEPDFWTSWPVTGSIIQNYSSDKVTSLMTTAAISMEEPLLRDLCLIW